jgi:hypothetical protein
VPQMGDGPKRLPLGTFQGLADTHFFQSTLSVVQSFAKPALPKVYARNFAPNNAYRSLGRALPNLVERPQLIMWMSYGKQILTFRLPQSRLRYTMHHYFSER